MSKQTTENTAFHAMDAAEALRILKSDRESGLRAADAEARLQKYGPNALKKGRRKTLLQRFILQFGDFMVLILLGAAAVSFATSCLQGEADFADTLLEYMRDNGGTCPVGDKSDAEDIKDLFHVSKKVFKRAVGDLYKRRLISISDNGLKLND